jgi:hypothetical protein
VVQRSSRQQHLFFRSLPIHDAISWQLAQRTQCMLGLSKPHRLGCIVIQVLYAMGTTVSPLLLIFTYTFHFFSCKWCLVRYS